MSSRRSKRKSTIDSRSNYDAQSISAAHYVGYVEDGESVEAIMKKFEELDKIQNQPPPPVIDTPVDEIEPNNIEPPTGVAPLTEQQLEELFKNTSIFTVQSALQNNLTLLDQSTYRDDEGYDWYNDDLYDPNEDGEEYEDYDDIDLDDSDWEIEMGLVVRKRVKKAGSTAKRQSSGQKRDHYRNTHLRVLDDLGKSFVLVKKQAPSDPTQPSYVRIPPNPIPISWAHRISTIRQAHQLRGGKRLGIDLIKNCNQLVGFTGVGALECILMNPPLVDDRFTPTDGNLAHREPITLNQLMELPIPKLLKNGFLMIFVPKPMLCKVVQAITKRWNLRYIENVAWIQLTMDHKIAANDLDESYIRTSKLTLLMFRTEGDIDIRHQRSPDCVFDFVPPQVPNWSTNKLPSHYREFPQFIFKMIETLLPGGKVGIENGFKLIELWGHPKSRRDGWLSVYHKRA